VLWRRPHHFLLCRAPHFAGCGKKGRKVLNDDCQNARRRRFQHAKRLIKAGAHSRPKLKVPHFGISFCSTHKRRPISGERPGDFLAHVIFLSLSPTTLFYYLLLFVRRNAEREKRGGCCCLRDGFLLTEWLCAITAAIPINARARVRLTSLKISHSPALFLNK